MLRRRALSALALAAALALPQSAGAVTVDMKNVSATDPWLIVPMPDHSIWYLDEKGPLYHVGASGYLGGASSFYGLGLSPSLTSDPTGVMWGTGNSIDHSLSRLDAQGAITYPPALPNGVAAYRVVWGADNALWFTERKWVNGSLTELDRIGRRAPDGTFTDYGGLTAGADPTTIIQGPDGNLWFEEPGINSIGRMSPAGATAEFPLPPGMSLVGTRGREMTFGPGGDLYFIVSGGIARMTRAGVVTGGVINGGLSDFDPNAVAYGKDGNLWATECEVAPNNTYLENTVTRISPSGVVTRAPDGTFPPRACPMGIVAGSDGVPWLYEWNTGRAGRLLFSSPLATTDDPNEIGPTSASLNGTASPRGVATRVHFDFGPTTAYGSTTPEQAIGDGDDTASVTARLTGLQPSTTYHYRLVATSVIGTVTGVDATVTTPAVPPPPAKPLPPDRDGDGFNVTVDCDDLSAAIHPGAIDKPGDGIDQDCSGADAPYLHFQPHPDGVWKKVHGRIVFTRLTVENLPAGTSLKLSCSGRGCPVRVYTSKVAAPVHRLDVASRLKRSQLHKDAVIDLQLARDGYVTTIIRWTIVPRPHATLLCIAPGKTKASAC
jgi:virginiamycin B lyase